MSGATWSRPESLDLARTTGLAMLVVWVAIALSVVLQVAVVHVPLLTSAFTTALLSPVQGTVCIACPARVSWVTELRKAVVPRADAEVATR